MPTKISRRGLLDERAARNDKCDTLYDRLVGHAKAAIENDLRHQLRQGGSSLCWQHFIAASRSTIAIARTVMWGRELPSPVLETSETRSTTGVPAGGTGVQRGERGEARDRNHLPHVEDIEPGAQRRSEGRACGALSLAAKHAILTGLAVGKFEVDKSEFEVFHGRASVHVG